MIEIKIIVYYVWIMNICILNIKYLSRNILVLEINVLNDVLKN